MALIHGTQGLVYFVHQSRPQLVEATLLEDPEMLAVVTQIKRLIHDVAPVLNSPTIPDGAAVRSTNPEVPVHMMVKRYNGAIYLFAVGMRNAPTTAIFRVKDIAATATAEVLGENRRLPVVNGRFEDAFRPYEVHLYRLR